MTVPLNPPSNCRDELVRYLHLEFGEDADDADALKTSDLKFAGLFAVEGIPTYYWAYPRSDGGSSYVTWQLYANTYSLGMSSDAPDPSTRITDPAQCPALQTLDLGKPHVVPWWRRGPLAALFVPIAILLVLWKTVGWYRGMRRTTRELKVRTMREIVPQWVRTMDMPANDSRAALRPPAAAADIDAAAARLGCAIPAAVAEFYRLSNGVTWHNAMRNEPLPPIEELRRGREFDPPLSVRLDRYWEAHERADGEPRQLQVGQDDAKGMFNVDPILVDFAAVDDMAVISRPEEAKFLAVLVTAHGGMPEGTVLEVEGTYATRYADLAHWFAGQVAMYGSLHEMQDRVMRQRSST